MISKYPQRTAWLTVLTGFVFLCVICIASYYGARWFIFDSSANLVVTARVAQGTITISSPDNASQQAIQSEVRVKNDELIRTDNLSQGQLSFSDPFGDKATIATVQLMPGSEVELTRASRSRFGIGESPIVIQLDEASGQFNINISPRIEGDIRLELRGHNQQLRFNKAGYFIVTISESKFSVVVREGEAIFIADNDSTKLLEKGQHGIYHPNQDSAMQSSSTTTYNIVPNAIAKDQNDVDLDAPLVIWGCGKWTPPESENNPPTLEQQNQRSHYEETFFDDRITAHFWRVFGEEKDGNQPAGSTCKTREGEKIPVDLYESLKIRVTMYLASHSLNGCGIAGSECVLMLRIVYRTQSGESMWFRGFYIDYNPAFGDPIRCQSCFKDHMKVNGNTWFTFESDDFVLDVQDENSRPVEITQIEFYSLGHSFDAYVSEFAVVGVDDAQ